MKEKRILVTAVGKNRLEILGRITALYLQRHIPVESLVLEQSKDGNGYYKICAVAPEESIVKIVNQIGNIVDISRVEYTYNHL